MKRLLFTISLLFIVSNMAMARERINQDPNAHVKPTNSTEIEAVEVTPTVVHMSETEEIIMETAPTTEESSETETETTVEETTQEETQVVVPEVEQAFVDDKVYSKDDMPSVGYSRKDEVEGTNATVETIQNNASIFALLPFSSGVRISYRSDVRGWAEFDITYKTIIGNYTNTVIKPIAPGLNILSINYAKNDNVSFISNPNVYCSSIRRVITD